tara:strand:- start:161 stop:628 length:468 start_codon:yes stop_codon:yes gene_type:complete
MKIKGFENYEIFEDGRIVKKCGLVMKSWIGTNGYKKNGLRKDGKQKNFSLHRLLAIHFIENTRPGIAITVDHIDRDKLNNSLENLRWATLEEQIANRGGKFKYPITKGGIGKNKKWYKYQWHEDKIQKWKCFKTLDLAKAFEIDHLKTYRLQFIN